VDVHCCETGHVLPPVPRQPGVQRLTVVSQTRPDVVPPQSVSAVQPHWPPPRQRAPARSASHAAVIVVVHSVQALRAGSQTSVPAQSVLTRHSTQRPAVTAVSHRGSGFLQSVSIVQPVVEAHWPAPFMRLVHMRPAGQSLRGAIPQPGVQIPLGPLQMMPDIAPPQVASASGPAQPQSPVAGRQVGLTPPQRVAFVGEHSVHEPASGPAV
jgi:hypothetical protein